MHILTGYNRDTEETFGVRRHYVSPVTEVIGFKSQGLMSWSVPDIPVNPPEDPKNPDDPTIIIDPSDDYGGQIGGDKGGALSKPGHSWDDDEAEWDKWR